MIAARPERKRVFFRAALAWLIACAPAYANMVVGQVQMVIPAERFRALKLPLFPDGSMFEVRINGGEAFFAAQGGPRDGIDQGTIELGLPTPSASLSDMAPIWTSPSGQPIPSLRPGFKVPPPDENAGGFPAGASFDRDYAGGGPGFYDTAGGALIGIYHGEYHEDYPSAEPFYTSLGLAISHDFGRNFKKLGIVIRPQIAPDKPIPPSRDVATVPSSSGSLVQIGKYFYLYYSDLSPDGSCDGNHSSLRNVPCVAVARALVSDVLVGAAHGTAANWQKYYLGRFGEPGVGGRFSPLIVTSGPSWVRWPTVVYDQAFKLFLMADIRVEKGTTDKTELEIRESRDGLTWGPATQITPAAKDPPELNYPGIIAVYGASTCTTAPCSSYMVVFVRETNGSASAQPFTRDLLGVDITLDSAAATKR